MAYQGLRWLKCDLHMHNPLDNNWTGQRCDCIDTMANQFAAACYAERLDVIGMTSHSYCGLQFYSYLSKALQRLEISTGHRITLFPGFEITTSVGLGVHFVCLFNPQTTNIDHIISRIGGNLSLIGTNESVRIQKNLKDILIDIQELNNGIVILPHVFSKHGLLDGNTYPKEFMSIDFKLQNLYAVEVNKPISQMNPNFQKLFRSGKDCIEEWKRDIPIATVMSSDCKQLNAKDENGYALPNSIGYRYTWIKMSLPSVESLKQAFLDHGSRISINDRSPSEFNKYPYILSIKVENSKFLEDQEVFFSPSLNCIIGGRGSGKSSLLEYLRLALRKDSGNELRGDAKTKERIGRIRNTLQYDNGSGKITVVWQGHEGVQETVVWNNGQSLPSEQQEDVETFYKGLPASFFSQQQLTHMTAAEKYDDNKQQAQRLQDLIDGFFPDKMRELDREETSIRQQISEAFEQQKHIKGIEKEISQLKQEYAMLEKQCNARQELQAPAQRHQLLAQERQRLSELLSSPFKPWEQWLIDTERNSANRVAGLQNKAQLEIQYPHENEILYADIFINSCIADTAKNISAWIVKFNNDVQHYINSEPWPAIFEELNSSNAEFKAKLAEKGLTEADIAHLQDLLENKKKYENLINEKQLAMDERKKSAPSPELLLSSIYHIWNQQFMIRKEAVTMANKHTSGGQESYKVIEVTVDYQADNKDFLEQWETLTPDKRVKLGMAWVSIGNKIFSTYLQQRLIPDNIVLSGNPQILYNSPWEIIQQALNENNIAMIANWIGRVEPDLPGLFISHLSSRQEDWEKLRSTRIKDAVDLTLYRSDLSAAGMISKSTLSDGQRNTAALVLLLSQAETGPLIIDQPEEELDSEFIYNELLPLIRDKKEKRQLIFATHNANLPVNGDSELVYAFEARENKGKCLAQGGTDRKDVADAILKIMEGSAEAFRRRKNKYHF